MPQDNEKLFLPGLLDPKPAPWTVSEVAIRESAVDLEHRRAWVPQAHTPAQKLARLHEGGHIKYSPRNWSRDLASVLAEVDDAVDPSVVVQISQMLEENRIDWLLWDKHGIDLRPAREVLDWTKMPVPTEPLPALKWVLQLAWTVWASKGLHHSIPNRPPSREPDEATSDFFDACWSVLASHHLDLTPAVVRGCLTIYDDPTNATRNSVAAELAVFFPPKREKEEQPPEKEEEQEAQAEAAEEAKKEEKSRERKDEEPAEPVVEAVVDPTTGVMYMDIHDHTVNLRRTSTKIRRKMTPTFSGVALRFPQRYMIDKAIFGLRTVTEGGLMLDWSGSMSWTDADLKALLEVMPAITVGGYAGYRHRGTRGYSSHPHRSGPEGGRICVIAKSGRFSAFTGLEPGFDGGNSVDVEALHLLGRWPKPRFWLSDGFVCGGKYQGPHPDKSWNTNGLMLTDGNVAFEVAKAMRKYEILRIPNRATLHELLKRRRVTLFSTPVNHHDQEGNLIMPYGGEWWYPKHIPESPVRFQL
jgi:hypothetical protein